MTPPIDEPQNQPERKRRLSRTEQKARKKKQQKVKSNSNDTAELEIIPAAQLQKEEEKNEGPADETVAEEEPDYLDDWEPISIPPVSSEALSASSLGKWFPKAKMMKSRTTFSNGDKKTTAKASILLFYQYASWSESKADQLLAYLAKIAETRTLGGRVRVAPEGLNATMSSVDCDGISAQRSLRHFCQDMRQFDPVAFAATDFKFSEDISPDRHFKDLKLLPVKELVFYGIDEKKAPLTKGGTHVDALEFHSLLEKESTVVIDVRNHYEAVIGRFDGQDPKYKTPQEKVKEEEEGTAKETATYLDPRMRKSTDFPKWLAQPETQAKLQNKTVLMYCTGGVRCERASAYINSQMGESLKGIYQLKGGVERYLKQFPDGGHWKGKNFVFDKREAVGAENPDGDGGVVRKEATKKKVVSIDTADAKCCICDKDWQRYIGKKKCKMCGVPVLMCDGCMTRSKREDLLARCPLCVEENITVPADDVDFTDNGISGKAVGNKDDPSKKAAPSVLKWGGGHAQEKKQKRKMKRTLCQFGEDCVRKDCYFLHPKKGEQKTAEKQA
jgi:predicted sulfurtransferase